MKGRIFKFIGILLGSIFGFIAVVIGVMAIQGKFKTPIVYPSELIFETNDFVVVNDDTLDDVHIHSFVLSGINGNNKVNKDVCYIRFVTEIDGEQIYGDELVALCDAGGNLLSAIEQGEWQGFYRVRCNTPIYFKFKLQGSNLVHYQRTNFGKVAFEAYDERGMVKSNKLVFNVDKSIEEIKLNEFDNFTARQDDFYNRTYHEQTKDMMLGGAFSFDYSVNPAYSIRPYSDRATPKAVELYYCDNDLQGSADYQLINENFVSNPQHDFLTYQGSWQNFQPNSLFFEPKKPGKYQFVVAVFDSYNAQLTCPQTMFLKEHVQKYMVYTMLTINVSQDIVSSVDINNNSIINLDLYKETALTFNGGMLSENDLGLTINNTTTSDLFDTIEFGLPGFSDSNISFTSEDGQTVDLTNYEINGEDLSVNGQNYKINFDESITIKNCKPIKTISLDGVDYFCKNGVAFVEENKIHLLRAGGYLDFFVEDGGVYSNFDLPNSFSRIDKRGSDGGFNILVKKEPAENLKLLILMVNADGTMLFDATDVNVRTKSLSFNAEQEIVLDNNYKNGKLNYAQVEFENVVNNIQGSYTACVLVVEQNENNEYSICVLENYTYTINGTTYVLVGVFENGTFKNVVRAKDRADSAVSTLYLLQLKNDYEQTTEQFINAKQAAENYEFLAGEVANFYSSSPITVTNNYQLIGDYLEFAFNASSAYETEEDADKYIKFENNFYHILENTDEHILTIKINSKYENDLDYKNMLSNIFDRLSVENFACYINVNGSWQLVNNLISITEDPALGDGQIVIKFNCLNYIDQTHEFYFGLNYNDTTYYSPKIFIDSQEVKNIKFYCNDNELELPTEENATLPTIKVTITGIENDEYSYEYNYNGATIANIDQLFNLTYDKSTFANFGFAPTPAYSSQLKAYRFSYSSTDNSIATIVDGELNILKVGECKILVRCNDYEAIGYIGIEIEADNFDFQLAYTGSELSTDDNVVKLNECVKFTYNGTEYTDAKFFTISNIKCGNYSVQENGNGFDIKDNGNTYLTISIKEGKWTIERKFAHSILNVVFNVSVATQTEAIEINILFNSAIGIELNPIYNATIYAGTTVLLGELETNSATDNNPIFKIKESQSQSNSYKIKYVKDSEQENADLPILTASGSQIKKSFEVGNYMFNIYSSDSSNGDTLLASYNIIVVPNVVFSQNAEKKAAAKQLESDTSYNLVNLLTIQKYNTEKTYGLDANYSNENLVKIESLTDLKLTFKDNEYQETDKDEKTAILTLSENNIKTLWLTDLDEQVDQTIKICSDTAEFAFEVCVTNKYAKHVSYCKNHARSVSSGEETSAPISISYNESWALNSVEAEGYTFKVENGKFTLNEELSNAIENASLTFTFTNTNDANKLTYKNLNNQNGNVDDVAIVLNPYEPKTKTEIIIAYSNSQSFDIFDDVFESIEESIDQNKISSIEVVKVSNANLFYNRVEGLKYGTASTIQFNEIDGNSQNVTITYKVVYANSNLEHEFDVTFAILNRQTIEMVYQYDAYNTNKTLSNFALISNDEATREFVSNLSTPNYEPVNVGQTISFNDFSRVKISSTETKDELTNQIENVSWVAYTGSYYANMVKIEATQAGFNATFDAPSNINFAYLIFKITTKSKNYNFYIVRLFNQTLKYDFVDENSQQEISLSKNNKAFYTNKKFLGKDLSSIFTNLPNSIKPDNNNLKFYLLEGNLVGDVEVGEQDFYIQASLKLHSCVNDKTFSLLDRFSNFKIAVIYIGGNDNAEIYLGNILVRAKSKHSIETDLPSEDGDCSGVYYKKWQISDELTFANPFNDGTSELEFVQNSISNSSYKIDGTTITNQSGTEIFSISRTGITKNKYLTVDISFTVRYRFTIYDKIVDMFVNFDVDKYNLPTLVQQYTVGNYVQSSGTFNETVNISLNGYQANETNIEYKIDNSTINLQEQEKIIKETKTENNILTITFKPVYKSKKFEFDMILKDLENETTIHIVINVESGVYINFPTGTNGYSSSAPYVATAIDGYQDKKGSSLDIVSNSNSYTIGGLTIIYHEDLSNVSLVSLEMSAKENENFVMDESGNCYTSNKTKSISLTETEIYFAHTALDNVIVELNFNLLCGENQFENSSGIVNATFYVKVPKTYDGLKAVYFIKDADPKNVTSHENVKSASKIEKIRETLTSNMSDIKNAANTQKNINNKRKLALQIGDTLNDGYDIGLTDKNNPNYLNIAVNSGDNVMYLLPNGESDEDLQFPSVSNITQTWITLSNNSGVTNVRYNYQIMPYDFLDGISPMSEYLTEQSTNEETQQIDYSFVISSFSTQEMAIASMLDPNCNALYITNAELQIDAASEPVVVKNIATNSYSLTYSQYTLTISLTTQKTINIRLTTTGQSTATCVQFALDLYGCGGKFSLGLNFYNCKIENYSLSLAAGKTHNLNLSDHITSKNKDFTFAYSKELSYYNYGVQTNNGVDRSNNLFEISENNETITLFSITHNASIHLEFEVKYNEKLIGYLQIDIQDLCSLQYKLTNSKMEDTIDATTANQANVYYYYMTNSNLTSSNSTFLYTTKLFDGSSDSVEADEKPYDEHAYYSNLNIYLTTGTDIININSINVEIVGNEPDLGAKAELDIIKIVKDENIKIEFGQDYSGTLTLKLTTLTRNGNFERYVKLKILGFIKLTYAKENSQDTILSVDGVTGFASGTQVNLISKTAPDNRVGLVISSLNEDILFKATATQISELKYCIVPFEYGMENIASIFEKNAPSDVGEEYNLNKNNGNFNLSVTLPNVEMSSPQNRVSYVVIYGLKLKYLNQTTPYCYVSYKVHNDTKITAENTTVDADSDLQQNSILKLFQFYVTYSANGGTYDVYYDGSNLKLKNNDVEYTCTPIEGDKLVFENEGKTTKITIASAKAQTTKLTIEEQGKETQEYTATKSIPTNDLNKFYKFYSISLDNILDFKDLIDNNYIMLYAPAGSGLIGGEEKDTNLYYKLDYIEEANGYGSFGIKLLNAYKDSTFSDTGKSNFTDNKFFNNSFSGQIKIMSKTFNSVILQTDLQLTTKSALTATGFTLNQIFGTTFGNEENYTIIGVGTAPIAAWVKKANSVDTKNAEEVKTIAYNKNNYTIKKATWSGSGKENSIYTLSKEFYYVEADSLVTVNYYSGEAGIFLVNINNFQDSSISAANMLYNYYNDGTTHEFKREPLEGNKLTLKETNDYAKAENNVITATWDNLIKYKNENPNEDFLKVSCTLSNGSSSFSIEIYFKLPYNETISVERLGGDTGSETIKTLELTDKNYNLTIPTVEGYTQLDSKNAQNARLIESQTNYSTISISNTDNGASIKILLDVNKINEYFNSNNDAASLTIHYVLTVNGQSVNIDVCVKKPS